MVTLDTAKLDLHAAMRTFAINVGFSIFPFVSLQKYLFLDTLFEDTADDAAREDGGGVDDGSQHNGSSDRMEWVDCTTFSG